jgi:PAS domain S-box-containing protein
MRSARSRSVLPSYLDGSLLLRGRTRLLTSALLVALYLTVGYWLLDVLDFSTNIVIGPIVLLLAWMWGSTVGVVAALVAVTVNAYWANAAGSNAIVVGPRVVEAVVISVTAFIIGHVGRTLERALGARHRADRTISELEASAQERMLTITDQVPVGLYRTTPDGAIVGGNEALMKILGFADRRSMLATNVWNHYVRTADRHQQLDPQDGSDRSWREFELRRADGSTIWVRDWSQAVRSPDGEILHFDGVIEDISEQRVANERFRAAFEDSPIGMTISGVDGRMIKGNAAVAELLGRPLEEVEGMHFTEYSFDEDLEMTAAALEDVGQGRIALYEKRLQRPDGTIVWALISLAPIHEGDGPPKLFISHVIDVTERHEAREALERLVKSKDELIASVSHELRTPLTVVHGLAQELDAGWVSFSVPEQKEFIGLIAQQSAEVAHIVEDLLVAARADIGKLPINAENVDLRHELDVTASTVADLTINAACRGQRSPVAFADGSRVRQIIRNLLTNAQRYGGSTISVLCGQEDGVVWVEVVDDGDGIPAEDAVHIFDPYFRAHNAAGQPSSVGLGLTVSRKLAQLMGGDLTYRYEDAAAVFRLELPAAGKVHGATGHGRGGNASAS